MLHNIFDPAPYDPEDSIKTLCLTPWLLIQGSADNTCLPDVNMDLYGKVLEPKKTF